MEKDVLVEDKTGCKKECYLCGGTEFNKRPGSVRDNLELEILECASCGLVFLSSFDHIRNGFYENSQMHDGEEMPDVQTWLRETAWDDERRFQYLKRVLPNRRLLDFGCGAGGFLLKARDMVATAHGVEPEIRLSSHYQSHGLTVFQNLSDISTDIRGGGYDIVTMFHVLEHIPDPKAILSKLSEMLTDDGQIIVEVPNADDALLTLYQCEPFSHFTYWSCHLFLFTTKTLKMLFTQVNLKVNYIKQIQRYPLPNHLYWLANGKPGGHQKWHFLDSIELRAAYEKQLAAIGKCDTILASVSKT
ncbi:class I SAM-dependent methyltransferase [Patescibacteria group bacterium]|nr:class I SAM-dependent methyltransferase [Patescibacteria group bacterium]MBU4069290.1 class I SAM-dependent methyltransferase [Pseudomonadota bacterium]